MANRLNMKCLRIVSLFLCIVLVTEACDGNGPDNDIQLPDQVESGKFALIVVQQDERFLYEGLAYFDTSVWDQHDNNASLINLRSTGGESAPVLWLARLGDRPTEGIYNVASLPPEPPYEYSFAVYDSTFSVAGLNVLDKEVYSSEGTVNLTRSSDGIIDGYFEITVRPEGELAPITLSARFSAEASEMGFPYF